MKCEIGDQRPARIREQWSNQRYILSPQEYLCGVPQALFLITTRNENGKSNACQHMWCAFGGDSGLCFSILTGIKQNTRMYKNILRDQAFCINFMTNEYDANCNATLHSNAEAANEIEACGLTAEPASVISVPRIKEAFLSVECTLRSCEDLSGKGITAMIVGKVINAVVDEAHRDVDSAENHFTYHIHAPKARTTDEGNL
jgi:flavin reductase (DIM6/NTAB) family NADH-FMN oxidoreductase RutF